MRLAEALQIRKDLQVRISRLSVRLRNNSSVQEGETPAEDPMELIKELDRTCQELEEIITRINTTNAITKVKDFTLTELISKRTVLSEKIDVLRGVIDTASNISDRIYQTDIKIIPTISVSETQKHVDRLSKELREVELLIQETNWTTDLI